MLKKTTKFERDIRLRNLVKFLKFLKMICEWTLWALKAVYLAAGAMPHGAVCWLSLTFSYGPHLCPVNCLSQPLFTFSRVPGKGPSLQCLQEISQGFVSSQYHSKMF